MKRALLLALGAGLLALPGQLVPAAATQAQTVATPAGIPVREQGLVATWYPPASGKRGPTLLVLGGSEGGEEGGKRLGEAFARQGYGVLALAYFKADGLPQQLQEIPLEYFDTAVAWLVRQPLADPKRIAIYGISKGGETALLVASRRPEIKAVIAVVPSSVVWQGINFADYTSVKSSFSLNGQPVPYIPYDTSAPFTGVYDLYLRSLKFAGEHPDAAIPVERIGGPVLLLSGRADTLWPSSAMADQVMARLDARGFRYPHRHIAYPDAGHAGAIPPDDGHGRPATAFNALGGTTEGNAAARADSWKQALAFLAASIGEPVK
ncbi:prolyl oligopeptidase family serine peptidase [Sphingomonas sp. LB-2]|uniref:acyl-CoA thioester hydrolase/BAAT C-terminal domain-containing protein n=1 Tax=Sphingomonas caeni TaxID=2984949 RepID=UPI00222E8D9E|nr:acyl-CoA thioester hydrolase/BAAT C-terminal domain-containing protein [Sphingomonas caeni]MCW3846337.1 prolyl oligopeptidase family serine peptidase [Sphingomonas caeni]